MGTSTSYDAPAAWGPLKREVTKVAGSSLPLDKAKELVRDFIAQNGGSSGRGGGGGSIGGGGAAQAAAQSIAGFMGLASSSGLDEALRQSGLAEYVGRPVSEIILALIDRCGGTGSSFDEVDARNATSRLFHELLDDAADPEAVDQILEGVGDAEGLAALLERFFGNCLYEQFCRVFFERLVQKHGDDRAQSFLGDIREYIDSALKNQLVDVDVRGVQWFGEEGRRISTEIMEQTLQIFES